jgi:hypothetical protein
MTKPLSRSHELGRAIGYNIDVRLVLGGLAGTLQSGNDGGKAQEEFKYRIEQAAVDIALKNRIRAKRLWIVVKVENGVPVMLDAYEDRRSANRRENFLIRHNRPEIDEVRVLRIDIPAKTKNAKMIN